jgi:hypothetical protein
MTRKQWSSAALTAVVVAVCLAGDAPGARIATPRSGAQQASPAEPTRLERGDPGFGSVLLGPVKDNTIFSEGSNKSNGAGQYVFAGSTAFGTARRALIEFDVAGNVPAGARITGVALTMQMSRTRTGSVPVTLNRLLADWGESTSDAVAEEGAGALAEPGDATWAHTFYDGELWSAPGGDYEPAISAALSVGGLGSYTWSSTEMIADVQSFLDDPASNFGWIVIGLEMTSNSAKRFDSRDHPDPARRPSLLVEYALGPFAQFTVNDATDANDANPGDGICETAAGNGVCTLRAAVEETNALPGSDVILLPAGLYSLTLTGAGEDAAASGDLDLTDSVDLIATGAGVATIDASALEDRVFHLRGNVAVRMSGLALNGGDAGTGAWGSTSREAGQGGAVFNEGGSLVLADGTVAGCSAVQGGAIASAGTLRVERSTLSGNAASGQGGALLVQGGTATLANVTVSGSTGEGIAVASGAAVALNNVTVTDATGAGVSIAVGGTVRTSNSLFAANGGGSCTGAVAPDSAGYNLDDGDTCGFAGQGDLTGADALLDPLADNGGPTATHALAPESPAVDAGSPASPGDDGACEAADQRGVSRPQGTACDIGAFEAEPPANSPPLADAGTDSVAECGAPEGALVLLDGSASEDPDSTPGTNDDIVSFDWYLGYGGADETLLGSGETLEVALPLGAHTVTLRVEDSQGETDTAEVVKTVEDTTDPAIAVSVTPRTIWPPNHRFVPVQARVRAEDACGAPTVVLRSISHDEGGGAAGDVRGAEIGEPDFEFELRAERAGNGDGRVYTIVYEAQDPAGNVASAAATVQVPHDMGRGKAKGRRGGRAGNAGR